ncbi:MAG: SDR family oxidoreductase [Aquincola sp.]|nr:SDR family oxidoreductase [Aquincola sp.]MDH4289378.1 SDR family oxidoreductase [Aquincola sp.]MDH5330952.1 SDR family oxidoreductase [Aquincola sp.]
MTPPTPSRPTVLVTGAARRIGRAIALELAGAGFDLALHYRRSAEEAHALAAEARAIGVRAECFAADLSDEASCRTLVPAVVSRLHRLDAIVNNASHFEYDDAAGFSHASMDAHWRANTAPAVLLAQALASHLAGCTEVGCVVNLSDQKLWNPNPDYFSYTLSKAALEAATTMLAMALAPQVRVAGVAPGVTLVSGTAMDAAGFKAAHRMTPLGRSSTPEDVARTVRFVIESPAITGTTLVVDGGQHLAHQPRDVAFLKPRP